MTPRSHNDGLKKDFFFFFKRLSQTNGNILVYIVMIMVIFGLLGAVMVSLFSTSISSSATANESRRAFYLAESGIRYGLGELRQNGFSTPNITALNNTVYKMPPAGEFDITVFGAWFNSPSNQSVAGTGGSLSVEIDKGKIPPSFYSKTLPAIINDLYLVVASMDPGATNQKPNSAEITKVDASPPTPTGDDTSFTFKILDDFVVGSKKDICMAIKPSDGTFTPGDSSSYLDVKPSAAYIFPKTDGSFQIGGRTYFYKTAKEENGAFRLRGITPGPGVSSNPVTIAESTDYILLAPHNYFITSKGTSGQVTIGGDLDNAASLSDHNFHSEPDIELDISKVSQIEDKSSFISGGADEKGDYLRIGGISGSALGAMWFNQPLFLGGAADYCGIGINAGKCFFKNGARVFFSLEYSGSGDGLIFALLNGQWNQLTSVGGDFEAPELLGYAGDSRLNNSGSFLDTTMVKGLRPPKIGLEFDTKVNFSDEFEKTVNYCSNLGGLKQNTRNDPGTDGRDAVQYVFWGNNTVDILCRGNNRSYDDNRHDATGSGTEDWKKPTGSSINTSPVLSPDSKTVYIASGNNLIAYDAASGELKWSFPTGAKISSSPTVTSNGEVSGKIYIYIGSKDGYLYAIRDDGVDGIQEWRYPTNTEGKTFGVVNTKPVVELDGSIYFASNTQESGFNINYFFALKKDKSQKWTALPNPRGPNNTYAISPVLSKTGAYVYLATTSGTIFRLNTATGDFSNFVSLPSTINFSPSDPPSENVFSPSIDSDGNIYVGVNNQIYAITPSGSANSFPTGSNPISSSPAAGPDGMVYAGNYNRNLYAVDTKGLGRDWSFLTGGDINSQPAVDANGHIYFGSNDNYVYALYSDGRLKWKYLTGGNVRGRPEIGINGSVYAGSFDYDFYAINQFANPKNFKNLRITSTSSSAIAGLDENNTAKAQLDVVLGSNENDWLKGAPTKGPWAVRMEVDRDLTATNSYYNYTIRTWLRQCADSGCTNIYGTFFADTRLDYPVDKRPPLLEQVIRLSSDEHADFESFIFGFTSALNALETQSATIRKFQLSFMRPNDSIAPENTEISPDPNLP